MCKYVLDMVKKIDLDGRSKSVERYGINTLRVGAEVEIDGVYLFCVKVSLKIHDVLSIKTMV